MSEHEEYMPIYNDPMYWSYLTRDKDNKKTSPKTSPKTSSTTNNDTSISTKKKADVKN